MTGAADTEVVERWVEAINAREFAAFDELFAASYVNHHRPYAQDDGVDGVRRFFVGLCEAIEGFRYEITELVIEDGLVRVRLVGTGRLVAAFSGADAVGAQVLVTVTHLYRVTDGRIAERWGDPEDPFAIAVVEGAA